MRTPAGGEAMSIMPEDVPVMAGSGPAAQSAIAVEE
jgi:hypothetical protein